MAADDDRHVRREPPDVGRQRQHFVGLEGVHGGDADQRRTDAPHQVFERATEAEIGQRHAVSLHLESRGDVFHAERLDAEERTETESFVAGNRTEQQDVHRNGMAKHG